MIQAILSFVRSLKADALEARDSDYRSGYINAIDDVEEYVLDEMWKEGYDDEGE